MKSQVALGEDSRRQFKRDVTNVDNLAAAMATSADSEGGLNDSNGWPRLLTRFSLR